MAHSSSPSGLHALGWLLAGAALWALFSGGDGWLLGLPTVLLATLLALRLGRRPLRLRWRALPGFLAFFLRHMLLGGWDVACRALGPRGRVAPQWHDYRLGEGSPRVRLLLSALVGLLPGTLASRVDGDTLRVHVLDSHQPWQPTVKALERRLAALVQPEPGT
ncbi:Na+/H+ antiporter subunit E [Pseudomonas oligotrophica]|uniref:Na+/H+ antiporter subunit E n=1 Tax=Pseudomonas oligotrophica TaxID=2912055 RepID=UPI001F00B117|nr:Na+/H+ antiporter subunit E [Pseudomonas oligotrophica]MCF7201326.1 Na+/H+ antiporter subunit E [Pseudomonas oligotrophica]